MQPRQARARRARPTASAVCFLGALALLDAAKAPAAPPRAPNVVIVSVDTLSRDALRAFSPAAQELPAFDALAAQAAVFTRAVSTASWTLPAHASLFTGLYPDRHGATDHRLGIAPAAPMLAELLGAAGYETAAFTDEGFVGAHYGFARGFERFNERLKGARARLVVPRDGRASTPRGRHLFDRGIAYLQQRPRTAERRPLFLFLHTYAVHDYYRVGVWAAGEVGGAFTGAERYRDCLVGRPPCTAAEWEVLQRLYGLELRRADASLAVLLATLDQALAGEPTLLVLLSDHGEGMAPAAGVVHHGGNLDPAIVRIPLLVRGPGIAPGTDSTAISLVDLMPTLLDLAGAPIPPGLDGHSFAARSKGGAASPAVARRALLAFEHCYRWKGLARELTGEIRAAPLSAAVASGDRWYVGDGSGDRFLAFDGSGPRREVAADRQLRQRSRDLIRSRSRLELTRVPLAPTPEIERELRALGYL